MLEFASIIIKELLASNNNDYLKVAKIITKQYNRGVYTKDEYDTQMQILSSSMIWGWTI